MVSTCNKSLNVFLSDLLHVETISTDLSRSKTTFRSTSCLVLCRCTRVWIIHPFFAPRELGRAETQSPHIPSSPWIGSNSGRWLSPRWPPDGDQQKYLGPSPKPCSPPWRLMVAPLFNLVRAVPEIILWWVGRRHFFVWWRGRVFCWQCVRGVGGGGVTCPGGQGIFDP